VKQLAYHNKKNGELTKVLIKLYKQQQAKIDEAANQRQVFDTVKHENVISCYYIGSV